VYDVTTGEILKRVIAPPDMIDLQVGTGQEFFLNPPEEATHIIDNVPVVVPPPDPTLQQVKAAKLTEIKRAFECECMAGTIMTSLGFSMDARRSGVNNDLENMQELATYMEEVGATYAEVTDANNQTQVCLLVQVQQIAKEIRAAGLLRYQKKFTLRNQVNAATTKEEVEAITWETP
jgi:hypothetical protein